MPRSGSAHAGYCAACPARQASRGQRYTDAHRRGGSWRWYERPAGGRAAIVVSVASWSSLHRSTVSILDEQEGALWFPIDRIGRERLSAGTPMREFARFPATIWVKTNTCVSHFLLRLLKEEEQAEPL